MTEQSQRVVLITGAAGGVGQAAVQLFLSGAGASLAWTAKNARLTSPRTGCFYRQISPSRKISRRSFGKLRASRQDWTRW